MIHSFFLATEAMCISIELQIKRVLYVQL